MPGELEFWFEFASTYSYLAAERIEPLATKAGVRIAWRPFLLGPIFRAQGWNDSPFNVYPAKGRYMWRDMERLCDAYGLPLKRPSQFPRNGLLAARVATAGGDAPWLPAYVRSVYRANFADDRDISDPMVVGELVRGAGGEGCVMLKAAETPEVKATLRARTDGALERGLFGAPTFLARGELFWGNDRLDDAIAWAAGR
jgi:2-hydroxychromene-2-carboxylate isomerase